MTVTSAISDKLRETMWNRVSMYHEVLEYMKKLPDPKISWRTDRSDLVGVQWLHDYRKPEWGHVTMYIRLEYCEYYDSCIGTLKEEIARYNKMKREGVSDGH